MTARICNHVPVCPLDTAPDHDAARVVADHHDQGWILLCNGVVVWDDTGEILPNRSTVAPHRPACACGPHTICEDRAAEVRDALVANPVPA